VGQGAARAGRGGAALERVGFVVTAAADDRAEALDAARGMLAYLFRSKLIAENVQFTGTRVDLAALAEAAARRDWAAAERHITDEIVQTYAIAGTPEECRRQVGDYLDLGLTVRCIRSAYFMKKRTVRGEGSGGPSRPAARGRASVGARPSR
jgi:alkanesulfonate monooxygenase SsuD/methylene tetrahydromethanopterin reductase-like flavin-dependent oxidoreductase (luciferase family)